MCGPIYTARWRAGRFAKLSNGRKERARLAGRRLTTFALSWRFAGCGGRCTTSTTIAGSNCNDGRRSFRRVLSRAGEMACELARSSATHITGRHPQGHTIQPSAPSLSSARIRTRAHPIILSDLHSKSVWKVFGVRMWRTHMYGSDHLLQRCASKDDS